MSANDVSVFDILCGRYQEVLKGADLKGLAIYLAKSGIVSDGGLQRILTSESQREVFAQVLAQKGSAGLVECRVAIDKFKRGVQPTEFTNFELPGASRKDERSGSGDGRKLNATEEQRSASPRSSTGVQCNGSVKSHVDTSSLSVRNFVALFSALLHHLTEALYCSEMKGLLVDIPLARVTSYLPKEYQEKEGVVPEVSLSNLLEAFQEECVEKEELGGATKRKGSKSLPPVVYSNKEAAELQLEKTSLALKRSEERNHELVRVTQEWAEECREKENMVARLQRQLKTLEGERDTLLAKYSKAKYMLAGSSGGGGGLGRGQFEEMRCEMAERKDVRDKPTSCDTTHLQEENRQLRNSVRQLEENVESLNRALMETKDELLAARLNLEELQQLQKKEAEKPLKPVQYGRTSDKTSEHHRYPKAVPRTQAMVTGYTQRIVPSPVTSRSSNDATPITSRSSDDAPPIISRSPDDDPSPAEHPKGTGNQIVTSPASPHVFSSYPPSPQPLFPRSRSPHHSPLLKPHVPLEVPVIRPHPRNMDDQSAVPVPQAVVVVETERKCPSCQHIFYTLGEREFQSHVAGCFK